MKKIILILAIVLFVGTTYSQETHNYDYYLQKSKKQKTAGWILLGAGTAMFAGGAIGVLSNPIFADQTSEEEAFGVLMLAGLVADLVSIPLFIAASKNKKKAVFFAISHHNILIPQGNSFSLKQTPALTLRMRF